MIDELQFKYYIVQLILEGKI